MLRDLLPLQSSPRRTYRAHKNVYMTVTPSGVAVFSYYPCDIGRLKLDTETTKFSFSVDKSANARELMTYVLYALKEKGYNPINQLVGYFISGDPTYITSYKGARGVIKRIDRDELLEVIISEYCSKL